MKFRMVHNNLNVFDLDKSIKFYQLGYKGNFCFALLAFL